MKYPFIIAHRGFSGNYPENTLKAFEEGIKVKADGLECDIHLTKDKKVVVMHDHAVDRTTNGKGLIADQTLAQLRKLDAGSWKSPKFKGEKIPKFEELLDLAKGKTTLYVEVKDHEMAQETADAIRKFKMENQVTVISFLPEALMAIKALSPLTPTLYLRWFPNTAKIDRVELVNSALRIRANGLAMNFGCMDIDSVRYIHSRGLYLNLWTIDDPKDMKRVAAYDADSLTTDYPDIFLKTVGR